jgi:hypothetical protein
VAIKTKLGFQICGKITSCDSGEFSVGTRARRESVVRPSEKTLPWANRLAIGSVLVVLASCVMLTAQNVVLTGALGGRVTDQSGAVVPGASVVVQNLQTGVKQSTETNHAGLYRFPVLRPGSYSIAASLKGFRDVQALVRVLVGNSTSLDMNLQWEPAQTRLR